MHKYRKKKRGKKLHVRKVEHNNTAIAIVESKEPIIKDLNSALDIMAKVVFEEGCDAMVINKAAIGEEFFDLSTRLAGEIIQKFVTYQLRVAIIGDFSIYTSKALKDFIYESNHGKDLFFVADMEEGIQKLS